ncbi:MAG TPA: type VI secretion system tube protein TssD [Polyangiaceae bacterium]|nr:type VI secretion system tube protein TssD [Polyangiaceae bacterium]
MFTKKGIAVSIIGACLVASTQVGAAEPVYLTVRGQRQGDIKGDVTQRGREGSMEVTKLELGSSGSAGARKWESLKITKHVDQATPLLLSAYFTNENLTTATLKLWRPAASGVEEQYLTISLVNAQIASDRIVSDSTLTADGKLPPSPPLEEIAFTFQKITVTYTNPNKSVSDDWH